MTLRRRAIVPAALGAVALAAAAFGALLLADDESPARGDLIAFSCREPANDWFAVCVERADGTGRRQLTSGLPTSEPSWSHDGATILFTGNAERGEYSRFAQNDIHVVDTDGGEPRQLTHTRFGRSVGEAAWAPDGSRIAFVRGTPVPSGGVTWGVIYLMNADGSDVRRVTSGPRDTDPAWSPDGSRIAFSRASGSPASSEIYVVGTTGGRPRRLTRIAPERASGPAWSPDGTRIAFVRTTLWTSGDGRSAVWVVNGNGTGLRRLVAYRHFDSYPGNLAWSPDGSTIAFVTSPALDCTAIELLHVPSGEQRPLTSCSQPSQSAEWPSWQPAVAAEQR